MSPPDIFDGPGARGSEFCRPRRLPACRCTAGSGREGRHRGFFDSYNADRPDLPIFDTNRAWSAQLPSLLRLFPEPKLICLVRDVAWVMDSLERQFRTSAFEHTRLQSSAAARSTVYPRTEALAGANRLVGFAWHALKEACYSEFADRLEIVDYDLPAERAPEVFGLLYRFLGDEPFAHDFASVSYDSLEFDTQLGLDALHRVYPTVAPRPRETIRPPDLFRHYSQLAFWRDLTASRAFRIVPQAASQPQRATLPGGAPPLGDAGPQPRGG